VAIPTSLIAAVRYLDVHFERRAQHVVTPASLTVDSPDRSTQVGMYVASVWTRVPRHSLRHFSRKLHCTSFMGKQQIDPVNPPLKQVSQNCVSAAFAFRKYDRYSADPVPRRSPCGRTSFQTGMGTGTSLPKGQSPGIVAKPGNPVRALRPQGNVSSPSSTSRERGCLSTRRDRRGSRRPHPATAISARLRRGVVAGVHLADSECLGHLHQAADCFPRGILLAQDRIRTNRTSVIRRLERKANASDSLLPCTGATL